MGKTSTRVEQENVVRRGRLFVLGLILCAALTAFSAPSASATLIGLNEGPFEGSTVAQSGADLFRVTLSWRLVEEKREEEGKPENKYDWLENAVWEQTLDQRVEQAALHGYSLIGLIAERKERDKAAEKPGVKPHLWYYHSGETSQSEEFQAYVDKLVRRYGRNGGYWKAHPNLPYRPVTIWEVWNEPNSATFSPQGNIDPAQYAKFLVATASTIRTAQNAIRLSNEPADTVVLHGGLYQAGHPPAPTASWMAAGKFVEAAAPAPGYGSSFDGFGLHPYSFVQKESQPKGSEPVREEQIIAGVKANVKEAREVLNSKVGPKPIWITELGWPVGGTNQPLVTEPQQKSLLTKSFNWAKTGAYGVVAVTWYNLQDSPGENWAHYTGLRRGDNTFRPAWSAFQQQAASPVVPPSGGRMAFQANNSLLITNFTASGGESTGQGMAANTSPSIARLSTGGYQTAFQANNSQLITWGAAGNANLGQGLAANTSPSIAGLTPSGYQIAFQANNSQLITMGTAGNANTLMGMAANTSPAISGLVGGGYQIAFQANTSQLWTTGSQGTTNWGIGMAPGTSPSIAGLTTGGHQIAVQTNNSQLWTVGSAGNLNTQMGMAPGTSPSIAPLVGGGYQIAFQTNSGQLWTTGTLGTTNWEQGMAPGTSPSIAALPNGSYQVAFQSNNGQLITIGPGISLNTGQGMAKGTSPDIAPG